MKKIILIIPLIGLSALLFSISCGNTSIKGNKYFAVTRSYIGVANGNTITFYERQGNSKWIAQPDNNFTIPGNIKDMFIEPQKIGVLRPNGRVDYYRRIAPKQWEVSKDEGFNLSAKYQGTHHFGWDVVGYTNGDTMDFYNKGIAEPRLKFVAPKGNKGYFAAGGSVSVKYDKGLEYYKFYNDSMQWKHVPEADLNYPSDMKGLMTFSYDIGVGIIKEKSVDYYVVDEMDGKIFLKHHMTFALPR
jgi:hypothetical protein